MAPGHQRVVYYAAASTDGYIASEEGGVEWLSEFSGVGGYDEFFAGVGSLVLGRTTFDQALGWGWPYGEKPSAILTSSPLSESSPPSAFAWAGDDPAALAERLRGEAPGDVWVVGGGKTAGLFLAEGVLEEVELTVLPVLLGTGIPLWPEEGSGLHRLEVLHTHGHANGAVHLHYRVSR
ncbi:MAG: dihydrofolate reductase family protein [Gaiellaceae bacterium]